MSVLKSSQQAVSYYERDDYYAAGGGDPDAQGHWIGRGAEALGLVGGEGGDKVDRDVFKDLLDGKIEVDGKTVQLGRPGGGENAHTPGWDLTFSAPKSVSILAEIAGDERLLEAHTEAVKTAVEWLEENVAAYRQQGFFGVKEHRSGNIVAAIFQHDTSRNQDPQTHTHVVVLNATQREDGKWASLHSKPLFEYKMAAGNIYRAALAQSVQKLGYEIEKVGHDGRFELSAVPAEMRELFATRREEIKQAMADRGLSGAESAAQAAMMTRASKEVLPREELTALWNHRSRTAGFDISPAVGEAKSAGDVTPTTAFRASRAVEAAVDRLAEPEAVFSKAELLRWSLAAAMGRGSVKDIEVAIAKETENGRLQEAALNGRQAYTTPRAKEHERRILESVKNGRGAVAAAYKKGELQGRLDASGLNAGQTASVELIVTTEDRFVGTLGRPGTGKTFMLSVARELLEGRGFKVLGMAQASEAARKLQADSGIKSGTIQKHLSLAARDLARLRTADKQEAAEIRGRYEKQVWVVDESSQVDAGLMRRVTFNADRLGARVVLIGDTKQLASIAAGKPFDLMLKGGMQYAEMDDIRRQSDPQHKLAIRQVIDGKIEAAVATLGSNIRETPEFPDRVQKIVDAYRRLGAERKDSFVLTAGNQQKLILNEGMRGVLREEGKLAGERSQEQLTRVFSRKVDRIEASFYKEGFVVRFPKAIARLGVDKADYLRVVATDKRLNLVTLEKQTADGWKTITWNPAMIAGAAKNPIEVYRPYVTTLAQGETIRWTRNASEIDPAKPGVAVANGQILNVLSSEAGRIEVQTDSGARMSIDTIKMTGRHWEHAYASTVYSSQGGTAKHVLVNAESDKGELFSQKAFLVAISRQKENLTVFTDDIRKFAASVQQHSGDKTSALEGKAEAGEIRRDGILQATLESLARLTGRNQPAPEPAAPAQTPTRPERDLEF